MTQPTRYDPDIIEFINVTPRSSPLHGLMIQKNLYALRDLVDTNTEGVTPEQKIDLQNYVDWKFDSVVFISTAEWSVTGKTRKSALEKLIDGDYIPEIFWRILNKPKRSLPIPKCYSHFESFKKPRFVKPGKCYCGCSLNIDSYEMAKMLYKMHCLRWKLDFLIESPTLWRRLYLRFFDLKTTVVLLWHNFQLKRGSSRNNKGWHE